eukprot:CAMPEP_0182868938 /NCGR_PEP_ID=MMETSP0034_2-20130328/9617_1 /TAXON_ID=156128 /ORGANISM="Nephroselmis pyriformis, Strain CCMP717" /LENGTH=124 /DNA_ID=CAMNT_0025001367 /DNA_START=79 /DNA_END=453 /DNA_ORIENTATION=+
MSFLKTGFNIERLVKENEQYARAEDYANGLLKTSQTCEWHEKQFQAGSRPTQHMQMRDQIGAGWETMGEGQVGEKDEMSTELSMANRAVNTQRKARLKLLLDAERGMYDQELNAMGLAVARERV